MNGAVQSGERFLDYAYSNDGELAQLNVNGGVFIENVRYAINGLQHLDIRNQGWRWSEDYDYDPKNGSLSRQTLMSSADPQQKLIDLHYGYSDPHGTGDSGQILVQEGVLGTAIERAHVYDAWGRLLSTKEKIDSFNGNPTQQLYSYDMYGNRLTVKAQLWSQGSGWSDLPAANTDGLSTPSVTKNRIQGSDYLYDDAGNLIRGPGPSGIQRYSYDAAGRLVTVQQENGPVLEAYQYGADRRRVAVSSDPDRRQWRLSVWSGNSEVARYDVDVSDATRPLNWVDMPIYFGDRLIAAMQRDQADGMLKVFHADHRDAVATTGSGQIGLKPQKVMPFGTENTDAAQRDGDVRFTSYRRSQKTGLDYAVNRYYDPKLGRFIQTDPLSIGAFNFGDPESWNAYTYVLNDPVNRVDPFGLTDQKNPPACDDKKPVYPCKSVDGTIISGSMVGAPMYISASPLPTHGSFIEWMSVDRISAFLWHPDRGANGGGGSEGPYDKLAKELPMDQCSQIRRDRAEIHKQQLDAYRKSSFAIVSNIGRMIGGLYAAAKTLFKVNMLEYAGGPTLGNGGVATEANAYISAWQGSTVIGMVESGMLAMAYAPHMALLSDEESMVALGSITDNLTQIDADMKKGLNCPRR